MHRPCSEEDGYGTEEIEEGQERFGRKGKTDKIR